MSGVKRLYELAQERFPGYYISANHCILGLLAEPEHYTCHVYEMDDAGELESVAWGGLGRSVEDTIAKLLEDYERRRNETV